MDNRFPVERCEDIIQTINQDNFDIYRWEILDIISLRDQTPVQRNFTHTNTNRDIIIHTTTWDIKLRDFIRTEYSIAPFYHHDGKDFWYRIPIWGNLWGKHIEYPKQYTNNFGFRLAIGHETAHAKNHVQENKNYKLFSHESAVHTNEKIARIDGYQIIKNMESTYQISLLHEFESIETLCTYTNIHLLSYIKGNTIDQIKQILLEPKHFGQ